MLARAKRETTIAGLADELRDQLNRKALGMLDAIIEPGTTQTLTPESRTAGNA